jgi:hypothetical protein
MQSELCKESRNTRRIHAFADGFLRTYNLSTADLADIVAFYNHSSSLRLRLCDLAHSTAAAGKVSWPRHLFAQKTQPQQQIKR